MEIRKGACLRQTPFYVAISEFDPFVDFGLGQPLDILSRILGSLATANMQEVQTFGSLIQALFEPGGIAKAAADVALDQSLRFRYRTLSYR